MLQMRSMIWANPDLADTAKELAEDTARTIVWSILASCLLLAVLAVLVAPDESLAKLGALLLIVATTSLVALRLVPKRFVLSQLMWQVGLILAVSVAVWLFRRPEISLFYIVLPFVALITLGWRGGVLAEVAVVCFTSWLCHNHFPPGMSSWYVIVVTCGGAFAGVVAWSVSRTLYTVAEWSLRSFAEARHSMDLAQRHRGQLARVVQDLDRAYYRLQRTNTALVAAWQSADEAERFKAEFATTLSHELRTPLNLIIGFSEMMMTAPQKYGDELLPRTYRSDLNAIYQNARHLMALVNDVLDLARIDIGRLVLTSREADLRDVVEDAARMVAEYVQAKGLDLQLHLPEELPAIPMDALRIKQVLLNLLVNAARFTERGWIRVEVTRERGTAKVKVSDTGRGIPEHELPRVFQEFHQGGEPVEEGWQAGVGLGLPISKRIVEMHGGDIGVESSYQEGTTFWFSLPDKPQDSPAQLEYPPMLRTKPLRRSRASKQTVVIWHDDLHAVSLLQRYLPDYDVLGARETDKAMALVHESKAVAMLADGRARPTGLPDQTLYIDCPLPNMRQLAQDFGVDDLLLKPVTEAELWGAIEGLGRPVQRVVVADDDVDMLRLLRRMLTPRLESRHCREARNGMEVLRLLHASLPDLLLLDLVMPGVNGQELLAHMADDPVLRNIPVIIISGELEERLLPKLAQSIHTYREAGFSLADVVAGAEAILRALAREWYVAVPNAAERAVETVR